MARTTTQLIVVPCTPRGEQTCGERTVDCMVPNVDVANTLADPLRKQGVCVIIRPTYNEMDSEGRFFREWRSFNGSDFKECRWRA